MRRSRGLQGVDAEVLDRYQQALLALPHDGNLQGEEALMARQRLMACQLTDQALHGIQIIQKQSAKKRKPSPANVVSGCTLPLSIAVHSRPSINCCTPKKNGVRASGT